jgi:hypothetical protein
MVTWFEWITLSKAWSFIMFILKVPILSLADDSFKTIIRQYYIIYTCSYYMFQEDEFSRETSMKIEKCLSFRWWEVENWNEVNFATEVYCELSLTNSSSSNECNKTILIPCLVAVNGARIPSCWLRKKTEVENKCIFYVNPKEPQEFEYFILYKNGNSKKWLSKKTKRECNMITQ